MFDLMRTAVRFFVVGFAAGVLLAPRSGAETRRMIREKIDLALDQLIELAALPPIEREVAGEPAAPRRARGRSRKAEDKGAGASTG